MLGRALPSMVEPPWSGRPRDPNEIIRSEVAALVAFAVVIGFFLYFAQSSAPFQWVLGVSFLAAFAALAWVVIVRRAAEPAPLAGPESPEMYREGELAGLAAAMRRASRGLVFSQVNVTSRAREAFVERARLSLGLSPEAMADVQRNPAELRRILDDAVLADFVHLPAGDLHERYRWVVEARERTGFANGFRDVLARMEAWR